MHKELAEILAQCHAEFGIYDEGMFNASDSHNIVHHISSIPDLAYLRKFYLDYQRKYIDRWKSRVVQPRVNRSTNVSRNVDLPFIGEAVIKSGSAKYMFVFEGSLSQSNRLSITVLSCLWPIANFQPIQSIFQMFWSSPYFYIVECLGITPSIARNSYVVDAVRIGTENGRQDRQKNRELLKREIELLNPEIVILVGGTAADTIGNKTQRENESLYFKAPFPTKRRSKQDIEKAKGKYEELRIRLRKLCEPLLD
jgi:hypothetical protein